MMLVENGVIFCSEFGSSLMMWMFLIGFSLFSCWKLIWVLLCVMILLIGVVGIICFFG